MSNEMTTNNMSTEEAIEILKGIVFGGFDRTTSKEREALDFAIRTLEERQQGEWIPVSKRLPEDFCVVLVYCPQFDNIYRVFRESDAWHQFSTSDVLMQAVTHWRPLPKAPESEAEE